MAKVHLAALGLLMLTCQRPAFAQVTVLTGKYTEGNTIRVISRVKMPAPPSSAYTIAMLKLATMAGQKGFTRLAVVKVDDCVSIGINNGPPIVQTCKIFGQMVKEGEVAMQKGGAPIVYYSLTKREDGVYAPRPEKEAVAN